jgi:NADP-dependent 3-hydroxy acid dehydrogenase YdfG
VPTSSPWRRDCHLGIFISPKRPQVVDDGTAQANVNDFYKVAIPANSVARAIAFAIEQPDDVDINEIVLRPTAQEF